MCCGVQVCALCLSGPFRRLVWFWRSVCSPPPLRCSGLGPSFVSAFLFLLPALALAIFLLHLCLKSASKSCFFFRFGAEAQFWCCNFWRTVVRSSIVFSNSVAADCNVMAASRFLAAAAVSSVDHAPVRAVIGRAMAVEEKKAMAVMPNELTKAGKLDSSKRVVGRIVEVEEKDANYLYVLPSVRNASQRHVAD